MNRLLGREESRGLSRKWPVSILVALLLAFVTGVGIFTYRNVEVWTPLQQWYWVQYSSTKNFPSPDAPTKCSRNWTDKGNTAWPPTPT